MSEQSQKLEVERLQSIVHDAKIRLDDRQQRLDDQRAEIERLKRVGHEALEQLSVAIIDKAKVEQQLAEQRAEIEHLDGLADRLKADVVRLGGEGVELRHQLKNQQAEIERLNNQLASAQQAAVQERESRHEYWNNQRTVIDRLVEALRPLSDVESLREGCHMNYNGGHREEETRKAFHHGMDTVCNVLTRRMQQANAALEAAEKGRK